MRLKSAQRGGDFNKMLYTIIPEEYIFEENNALPETNQAEIEVRQGSLSLICHHSSSGELIINRIISSNPQDYLNPDWQPGSVLNKS